MAEYKAGDYVKIIEDNGSGRYNGKSGTITQVMPRTIVKKNTAGEVIERIDKTLYLVDVDVNSGDEGTCVAKIIENI